MIMRIDKERVPGRDRPLVRPLIIRRERIVVSNLAEEVVQDLAGRFRADLADKLRVAEHDNIDQQRKETDHVMQAVET